MNLYEQENDIQEKMELWKKNWLKSEEEKTKLKEELAQHLEQLNQEQTKNQALTEENQEIKVQNIALNRNDTEQKNEIRGLNARLKEKDELIKKLENNLKVYEEKIDSRDNEIRYLRSEKENTKLLYGSIVFVAILILFFLYSYKKQANYFNETTEDINKQLNKVLSIQLKEKSFWYDKENQLIYFKDVKSENKK